MDNFVTARCMFTSCKSVLADENVHFSATPSAAEKLGGFAATNDLASKSECSSFLQKSATFAVNLQLLCQKESALCDSQPAEIRCSTAVTSGVSCGMLFRASNLIFSI